MPYQWLDMEMYRRKSHFDYFNSLAYPYVGLTANVDITEALRVIKEKKLPFFLTVCYCASRAANSVPELRQRIREGRIVQFDHCGTSHTVALEDGTYCYCTLNDDMPLSDYLTAGEAAQEAAKQRRSLEEDAEDAMELIFVSTLPWLSYTSLVQPVPMPADSNPRITWGKYFFQEGRTLLPVSLLCHHALADGMHIAAFYQAMDRELAAIAGGAEEKP